MGNFKAAYLRRRYFKPNTVSSYLLSTIIVTIATGICLSFWSSLPELSFILLISAVTASTFVCGVWSGGFSVCFSAICAWFFISSSPSVSLPDRIQAAPTLVIVTAIGGIAVIMVNMLRNAIERTQDLQERLLDADRSLTSVLEGTPDGVLLVDRSGHIIRANEQAAALFRNDRAKLVGAPFTHLLPERLRGPYLEASTAYLALQHPATIGSDLDWWGLRSDGTEFAMDVYFRPIKIAGQAITMASVRDKTDQRARDQAIANAGRQQALSAAQKRSADESHLWMEVFRFAAVGIAIIEPGGHTIQFVNPAYAAMRGRSAEELCGTVWVDGGSAEEQIRYRALHAEVERTGSGTYRSWLEHADGSAYPVQVDITTIREANGVPVLRVKTVRDITDLCHIEQQYLQARERAEHAGSLVKDALDSLSEAVSIWDPDDRLITYNETYLQRFPYARAALEPNIQFEEFVRRRVAAGEFPAAAGREEAWIAERIRQHTEATGEFERTLADGRSVRVTERRMRSGGIVVMHVDITAQKTVQAALLESQAHLERAQEIAEVGSWELDLTTGHYLWSKNQFRIRGFPPEFQPTRRNMAEYLHAEDHAALNAWFTDRLASASSGSVEIRVYRPDGELRINQVDGRSLADQDGKIRRLAGTTRDITEIRRIQSQLAQAQKLEALGNLTGGMAHDFNNLLGVIILNLDFARSMLNDTDPVRQYISESLGAATSGADLIRNLLAFARRQSLSPTRVDINDQMSGISRLLARVLGEHIEVLLDLAPDLWPVHADAAQIEASIVNLATNARDAMPRGGKLTITTGNQRLDESYARLNPTVAPGDYCMISISDTGGGMTQEVLTKAFEPFFSTKEVGQGSGLGLSMVFGFANQSGGHVSIYSEPGVGTTVSLFLPRAPSEVDSRQAKDASPLGERWRGNREVILVVEDNEAMRRVIRRQLMVLNYQVIGASSAEGALALLERTPVALVLTDVVMPGGMDGIELADVVRSRWPSVRVLLSSGFPEFRGASRSYTGRGLPYFLAKPYDISQLAEAVAERLGADHADGRTTCDHGDDHVGKGMNRI